MKNWILTLLLAIGLIGMSTLIARAADKDNDKNEENEKITSLDKIPAAAKDAIVKEAGSSTIDQVVQGNTKDGKTYYEGHYKSGDKKMEVKVDADGKVMSKGRSDEDDDKDKDKDKD